MTAQPGLVLSDDERLLAETARSLARSRFSPDDTRMRRDEHHGLGFERELWSEIAGLGWAGLAVPEAFGGSDAGLAPVAIVAEALASSLAASPLVSTSIALECLVAAGNVATPVISSVANGSRLVALASQEATRHDPYAITTVATRVTQGYQLSGMKRFVLDGAASDQLLVAARTSEGSPGRNGLTLFLVDSGAEGLDRRSTFTIDSRRTSSVVLNGVVVSDDAVVGDVGGAAGLLERAWNAGMLLIAAEMVGAMSAAFDLTLAHLKSRWQFGRPLGSFQALQHRAARAWVALELARSSLVEALRGFDSCADDLDLQVSTAKAMANESARLIAAEGIQMHGGMGITDESDIGLYFKYLRVREAMLGDLRFHRARAATQLGF